MHADAVKRRTERARHAAHEIVRIQDGILCRLGDALAAEREQIRQRAHHNEEVARKCAHLNVALAFQRDRVRQIGLQEVLAADRARAGAAAAVRRGERLVQIQMDAVKAHVAGAHDAHNGVQVRAVVVAQAARLMDKTRDLQNVFVKNADGVWVRQHQAGGVVAEHGLERLKIDAAVRRGRDVHDLIAAHGSCSRVRAMRGIRNDDLRALLIAAGIMILLDEQDAREFAVRTGCGLECHAVHARDLAQILLCQLQHAAAALHRVGGSQRMDTRKAGQRGHFLVDPGIILHGAGAERIEAAVHAVDVVVQLRIVAAEVLLAQLRQNGSLRAAQRLRQRCLLDVTRREDAAAAAGNASLKDQLHLLSTSFTMAMVRSSASRGTFSVAHHRMPPSSGRPPRISACSSAARISSCFGRSVTNSWKNSPE